MPLVIAALLALAATASLVTALAFMSRDSSAGRRSGQGASRVVEIRCAAVMRPGMERVAAAFTDETGIPVSFQFGGSGMLLAGLQIRRGGDFFIAADPWYIDEADKAGLVSKRDRLATVRPVIAVRAGNPAGIQRLGDLLAPERRFGLADASTAAISRAVREHLDAVQSDAAPTDSMPSWKNLEDDAAVIRTSVTELMTDLAIGAIDAAIVWDVLARQVDDIDAVMIPGFSAREHWIECAWLRPVPAGGGEVATESTASARVFLNFLTDPDRGGRILRGAMYDVTLAPRNEGRP